MNARRILAIYLSFPSIFRNFATKVANLLRLGIKKKCFSFVLLSTFRNFARNKHNIDNMQTIQVKDKTFSLFIPEEKIIKEVKRIAEQINKDYEGKEPVFLAVLNGSFIFAADLLKDISVPCEISFVKLASYQGVNTSGDIREVIGLNVDLTGRPVIIVEDIVDTGLTMAHMLEMLKLQNPASIDICTLLLKPGKLMVDLGIKYCCMEIPNDFIVGYGLDYDGFGRNTRDIYTLVKS